MYISRNIIHANKKFDVGIINFGINNLQSIKNATDKISTKSSWIQTPEDVMKSKVLILPGVGAFKHGMKGLRERKLIDAIKYSILEYEIVDSSFRTFSAMIKDKLMDKEHNTAYMFPSVYLLFRSKS